MNKIILSIASLLGAFVSMLFISCSDNVGGNGNIGEITFKVFECNEPFSIENSASARFVSEGAEITIWEIVDDELVPVSVIRTNSDGTVKYKHKNQPIYYSVSKLITQEGKENVVKQNLYYLKIQDDSSEEAKYLRFEIEGIFTSEDDIASHASFNISPEKVKYIPHVGTLKLKDLNGDGLIDERDAVQMSQVDPSGSDVEEVYLSKATVVMNN